LIVGRVFKSSNESSTAFSGGGIIHTQEQSSNEEEAHDKYQSPTLLILHSYLTPPYKFLSHLFDKKRLFSSYHLLSCIGIEKMKRINLNCLCFECGFTTACYCCYRCFIWNFGAFDLSLREGGGGGRYL